MRGMLLDALELVDRLMLLDALKEGGEVISN